MTDDYYFLNAAHTDPKRLRRERDKARLLKRTPWWQRLISRGECHYCAQHVGGAALTMDHVVPLGRGGESTKGNVVPACRACNAGKRLATPAEVLLKSLQSEEPCDL